MTLRPAQNRDRQEAAAATYLITFVCYGSWLPGRIGAVPRTQNAFGAPLPEADAAKERRARNGMSQEPYVLDAIRQQVVLRSLQDVCAFRRWTLLAAHVRTNHVHVVTTAGCKPEPVLNALKAYSSCALNQLGMDTPGRHRWARHGSTRYLWTSAAALAAIHYVVREQGDALAVFEMPAAR
jgi:REP element-mobilizing transposase RayT